MSDRTDPLARDLDALRESLCEWLDEICDLDDDEAAAAVADMREQIGRIAL